MNQPVQKTATPRTNDPERTMADILAVAITEFADKGLAGARIDAIAAATRTSKRMIYYYFGSKDGLYVAVLEEVYRRMRSIEGELHLDDLPPEDALRKLVGFTFDYQLDNPDFIRLVMNENIHRGEFLAQSTMIQKLNVPAINAVREVVNDVIATHDTKPAPELLVVNKIDAAGDLALAKLRRALPGAVFVSAHTGEGLERLRQRLGEMVEPTDVAVDVTIPYDRGDLVARVHELGRVDATEHTEGGTRIKAQVPVAMAAALREFAS